MKLNLIKLKFTKNTYYSSILGNKHYIYSFQDKKDAMKCMDFLNSHKNLFFKYPSLLKDTVETNNKYSINSDIYLEQEDLLIVKNMCLVNNIGLINITNFDYTFVLKKKCFDVNISGTDLLVDEKIPDFKDYIDNLNNVYLQ